MTNDIDNQSTGPNSQGLMDALAQVSFALVARLSQAASANDLSLTQFRVLAILRDRELQMSQLAVHLGLDRSTVSGLIDRAERRGLVQRFPDPHDRRSSRVRLTAAGHELVAQVGPGISAFVDSMVTRLTPRQRRTLQDLLERILPDYEPDGSAARPNPAVVVGEVQP